MANEPKMKIVVAQCKFVTEVIETIILPAINPDCNNLTDIWNGCLRSVTLKQHEGYVPGSTYETCEIGGGLSDDAFSDGFDEAIDALRTALEDMRGSTPLELL